MPASLAYRKAREAIWRGQVPSKYTRLLPYLRGRRGLEIGAAEGVLALYAARERAMEAVTALELRPDRHTEGLKLREQWRHLYGSVVDRCAMVCGDIRNRMDLLHNHDTLIAVRALYYLRDDAVPLLRVAHQVGVERIVLCGNKGRQARHRENPHDELGQFNRLASAEGMADVLESAGYFVTRIEGEGDPIVIGATDRP